MGLLFDSFWRAAAYSLHPRILMLTALPLLLIGAIATAVGYFYWDSAVTSIQIMLESVGWLSTVWQWLHDWGISEMPQLVAPLLLIVAVMPVLVITALLIVGLVATPILVSMVGARRFATLERKKGGSLWQGWMWMLGSTLLALLALIVSTPLWFVPPLIMLLPPLIWGWLTYRVMAFDALAEYADAHERGEILTRYRGGLLFMGVVCGYLGAAPAIVWVSGVVFAAAFIVLIPLAIWIYTIVFAFSSLWFAHFCLAALQQLRQERAAVQDAASASASHSATHTATPIQTLPYP